MQACYTFAKTFGGQRANLWPTVRRELGWMAAVLPLLCHNMRADWSDTVHCSDASPQGFGVCYRKVNLGEVQSVARQAEVWHFRAEATIDARANALRPDVLKLDPASLQRLPDYGALHSEAGQQLLDEVLSDWLNDGWKVAIAGKWNGFEDIMRLEGRGVVMSCRHILRSTRALSKHPLLLSDNLGLVLAIGKGRGRSARQNSTCR